MGCCTCRIRSVMRFVHVLGRVRSHLPPTSGASPFSRYSRAAAVAAPADRTLERRLSRPCVAFAFGRCAGVSPCEPGCAHLVTVHTPEKRRQSRLPRSSLPTPRPTRVRHVAHSPVPSQNPRSATRGAICHTPTARASARSASPRPRATHASSTSRGALAVAVPPEGPSAPARACRAPAPHALFTRRPPSHAALSPSPSTPPASG